MNVSAGLMRPRVARRLSSLAQHLRGGKQWTRGSVRSRTFPFGAPVEPSLREVVVGAARGAAHASREGTCNSSGLIEFS
jgi:hypothetical protein